MTENISLSEFEDSLRAVTEQLSEADRPLLMNIMLIRCVVPRLIQYMDRVLAPYDISSTAWSALMAMYSSPTSLLPSELSRILDLTRTTITRLSNDLVDRGWVTRLEDAQDRRKIMLSLTDAGREFVETAAPIVAAERTKLWAGFSETETQQFETLLRRLLHNLGD